MIKDIVAYIPVLNRQYLGWLKTNQPLRLFLIPQSLAEEMVPSLSRNVISIPETEIALMVKSVIMADVRIFDPSNFPKVGIILMPDEDVCNMVARRYLPMDMVFFESIWARWDMTAVNEKFSVVPDVEESSKNIDQFKMLAAMGVAKKSPDWWRQVAAVAFDKEGSFILSAYNNHFPSKYEAAVFGDPRMNFNPGDEKGKDAYISLHAEKSIIAQCARRGVSLDGASVYVTTFPCGDCARLLAEVGIKKLYFSQGYSVLKGFETLKAAGVEIIRVKVHELA